MKYKLYIVHLWCSNDVTELQLRQGDKVVSRATALVDELDWGLQNNTDVIRYFCKHNGITKDNLEYMVYI